MRLRLSDASLVVPKLAIAGVLLAVTTGSVSSLAGCKDNEGSSAEASSAAETSGQLTDEEEELLRRRDALLNSRRALQEKRTALAAERQRLMEDGADTTEVDKLVDKLAREERELGDAESQFDQDLEELFSQQRSLMTALSSAGDDASKIAAREAGMAGREKSLASRERRLADRESAVAERERALAVRERETCAKAPATIIQTGGAPGTRYKKKDVEPLLRTARRNMSKRGILGSDLPAAAQGLESEATKAMADGDYGTARFAAAQLVASVNSVRIDKGFIQAKIARLNQRMEGQKIGESTRKEVDELFRKATADYGDGKFAQANRNLNRIYTILGRS